MLSLSRLYVKALQPFRKSDASEPDHRWQFRWKHVQERNSAHLLLFFIYLVVRVRNMQIFTAEWRASMRICECCFSRYMNSSGSLKVRCNIWLMQLTLTNLKLWISLTLTLKWNEWYRENELVTIDEVTWELKINHGMEHHTIHEVLYYRKVPIQNNQNKSPLIWKKVVRNFVKPFYDILKLTEMTFYDIQLLEMNAGNSTSR